MTLIAYRQMKTSFTFPESGMVHWKRLLNPGTISSTVTDTLAKTLKSVMQFDGYFRVLRNSCCSYMLQTLDLALELFKMVFFFFNKKN